MSFKINQKLVTLQGIRTIKSQLVKKKRYCKELREVGGGFLLQIQLVSGIDKTVAAREP